MTANASINRAEKVRQRRNSRSQDRVTRAADFSHVRPTSNPAVTVRGRGMGNPILKKTSTQTRRKYYVALDAAGAELSMPAIPMIRPGWRLLSGLIVITMVVLLVVVSATATFQVKVAQVAGLQRLSQADVEAILDLKGKSIVMVDPAALRTTLEKAFPELSGVAINITLPANLNIAVRERQPVLAWTVKDKLTWIDAEGVLFAPRGDAGSLLTVLADGNPPMAQVLPSVDDIQNSNVTAYASPSITIPATDPTKQLVDLKIIDAAALLRTQMPEKSSLVYNSINGLGWTDPRGWKVYFGLNLDDMAEKLTMYQAIVDQLTQKKILPTVISVENINAPFYRLEH
jgi:cell division protein FtsQ